jgi:hypothetical protein
MKFRISSVVLAAVLAFAMAPAHAGNGNSGSKATPPGHEKARGEGHSKFFAGSDHPGKGLGHIKLDKSPST